VWRKLAIIAFILALVGLLPFSSGASAQGVLTVWHALAPENTDALAEFASHFEQQTGVKVDVQQVDPTSLFDSVAQMSQSGQATPDVIIAGRQSADLLLNSGLISAAGSGRTFFLEDLLSQLPPLLDGRCQGELLEKCLWPDAPSTLPLPYPDD